MLLTVMLLAAQVPDAESEALGRRLARTGALATIAPLLAAKDTDELLKDHPELDDADQARLHAIAQRVSAEGIERVNAAFGRAYAQRLARADLRALVAANESGAARRFRAAMPGVLAAAMEAIGPMDLKRDALAAFCRETGKACPKP